MWTVVKYDNGVEVEDYGVMKAANIRQLVKQIEKMLGITGLKYEKMEHFKAPTYQVFHGTNTEIWLECSKYN